MPPKDKDLTIWDHYSKQLFKYGFGLPVWDGDPEGEPTQEIHMGSVVYPFEGRLLPILNALKPANDPLNLGNPAPLPDDFEVLSGNIAIREFESIQVNILHSESIRTGNVSGELGVASLDGIFGTGAGYKFSWKGHTGAILLLDQPAMKQMIMSKRRIVTHMRANVERWERYANETLGLGLSYDDIWFISGTTKTTRWVSAAFHQSSNESGAYIDGEFANVAKMKFSVNFGTSVTVMQLAKYGPRLERHNSPSQAVSDPNSSNTSFPNPSTLKRNQCIFVHYYKMKKRVWWKSILRAAAGPHELPDDQRDGGGDPPSATGNGSGDEAEFEEVPPPSKAFDPVDALLDYILENSEAELAIGCDRDIISIFKGQPIPDDVKAGIDALRPAIDVDEDGAGTVVVDLELPNEPRAQEEVEEATAASGENDPGATEIPPAQTSVAGPSVQQRDDNDESLLPEEDAARRRLEKQPVIWEPAANGHTGSVTSLAVSPDSKYVASGSDDTTIILWDTEDQSVVRKWEAGVDIVWHLAFSPDSQRLACSGNEGRIVIWDVEQGDELGILEGHSETVHTVVWSPDGTKLASGSDDMTVRIWDAATYQEIYKLEGHNAMVTFVVFSPEGNLLASGGADFNCRIWEVETGALKQELKGHKGMVWTAVFDPETRRIATASDDGSVRIWRVETGEELVILSEHHGPVWAIAFTEDGKQIMSASSDGTIKICDSYSGERVLAFEGHDSMVNSAQFSPDGKYLASASSDNTVRLWNRSDGSCAVTFNEHNDKVTHAVFSPDGRTLSSGSDDGKVRIRVLSEYPQLAGKEGGDDEQ